MPIKLLKASAILKVGMYDLIKYCDRESIPINADPNFRLDDNLYLRLARKYSPYVESLIESKRVAGSKWAIRRAKKDLFDKVEPISLWTVEDLSLLRGYAKDGKSMSYIARVFHRKDFEIWHAMVNNDCEYHATKGVFDDNLKELNEPNDMSTDFTFAQVCRKLDITEEQKQTIMEEFRITNDDVLIDSDLFDRIYEMQKDIEYAEKEMHHQADSGTPSNTSSSIKDLKGNTCNICLKFFDKAIEIWNNNKTNPFNYERLVHLLTNGLQKECYFQNLASNDDVPRCTMFVVLSPSCCVEIRMKINVASGFPQKCCFFVPRVRVVALPPHKDCVKATCKIDVIGKDDRGVKMDAAMYILMDTIATLPYPKAEVNQEKDKEIWKKYVEALRKLVYQKEQIWKVKSLGDTPYYSKELANEEDPLLDIVIEEKDFRKEFEKEISATFEKKGLVDYGINGKTGFLEFSGDRELSKGEFEKLVEMASHYFYELDPDSPTRSIICQLHFKYNTENLKENIYPDIVQILNEEYQLGVTIEDDGRINIAEKDARHADKVITNKYGTFLTLYRDNAVRHTISAIVRKKARHFNPDDIRNELSANNITAKPLIYFTDGKYLHVKISTYLSNDFFAQSGFKFVKKTLTIYSRDRKDATVPIDGLYIEEGAYCVDGIDNRKQMDKYVNLVQGTLHDDSFALGRTHYVYEFVDDETIEVLRDFKTDVEEPGRISFNLQTSVLTIYAENASEHRTIIDSIRQTCPNVSIADAPYQPHFYIRLKGETKLFREGTITTILNALRSKDYDMKNDSYRNFETTAITYKFVEDNERKKFVADLKEICAPYSDSLEIQIENELGTTLYQFVKNDQLLQNKERELRSNIHQASFVYLTPDEYDRFKQARAKNGEGFDTREGVQIGTFVQKEGGCFTFKITNDFLDIIDTKGVVALTGGYIRPIFPGELTNINRMVKAMHKITSPDRDGFPANPNISNFIFDPSTTRIPTQNIEDVKKRILENLNEPLLRQQPKQLDAVAKAIAAQDITIIQGPPGTGKTTVIAEIIWQTLLENHDARILITSQTNLAVDNALERLKGKRMVRPIRIGNIEKFENEGKVYSDIRLRQWTEAPAGTDAESYHKDNAIHAWINAVCDAVSDDEELAAPLKKWRNNLRNETDIIKRTFSKQYKQHINVFAATCSECGSRHFSELFNQMYNAGADEAQEPVFDLVIMDEASKATPPELVLPLTLGKKVIVIGDHKQLPPMIDSEEFSEALGALGAKQLAADLSPEDLKVSQFEKLFLNAPDYAITSLDTQFRMHEQIMKCISQFYADQKELEHGLICGIRQSQDIPDLYNKSSRWHGLSLMPFIEPDIHAIWVNVDTPEQQRKNSTSYYNMGEVEAIQTVLNALTKADGFAEYLQAQQKEEDKEIGVITYYMSQMRAIRDALYPSLNKNQWRNFERFKYNNEYGVPFRINTVDRFQGMERNIVIVSTVRSDKSQRAEGEIVPNVKYPTALGFAKELQRINVGFSRAKRLLIVIGNKEHFAHKPEYANAIAQMKYIDIRQLQNL